MGAPLVAKADFFELASGDLASGWLEHNGLFYLLASQRSNVLSTI